MHACIEDADVKAQVATDLLHLVAQLFDLEAFAGGSLLSRGARLRCPTNRLNQAHASIAQLTQLAGTPQQLLTQGLPQQRPVSPQVLTLCVHVPKTLHLIVRQLRPRLARRLQRLPAAVSRVPRTYMRGACSVA